MADAKLRTAIAAMALLVPMLSCSGRTPNSARSRAYAIDTGSNQRGRLTVVTHASSAAGVDLRISYGYDARGRVVATQHAMEGKAFASSKSYGDAVGGARPGGQLVVAETFPDNEQVSYSYDAANLQQSIVAGSDRVVTRVVRDARGQTREVDYGDGTVTTHQYNDSSDLRLAALETTQGGADLQSYGYLADANGNVIGVRDNRDGTLSADYTYDSLDRMTGMSATPGSYSYDYDNAGNLTNKEGNRRTMAVARGRMRLRRREARASPMTAMATRPRARRGWRSPTTRTICRPARPAALRASTSGFSARRYTWNYVRSPGGYTLFGDGQQGFVTLPPGRLDAPPGHEIRTRVLGYLPER
jgi:YD repeat-containing protein